MSEIEAQRQPIVVKANGWKGLLPLWIFLCVQLVGLGGVLYQIRDIGSDVEQIKVDLRTLAREHKELEVEAARRDEKIKQLKEHHGNQR